MGQKIYAALDLGTHNCRLSIAKWDKQHSTYRVVERFSRHVLLGEGLAASGCLSDAAMERAIIALSLCQEKLSRYEIYKQRYVATQACRLAANSVFFIDKAYKETGLKLEIIDKQTEASLASFACVSLIKQTTQQAIVFDIGGGSSQISLVDNVACQQDNRDFILDWLSLPVGVVNLAEKFTLDSDISKSFYAMKREVCQLLQKFVHNRPLAAIKSNYYLLGMSGTATTLAGISLGLERYDRGKVDGLSLNRFQLEHLIADIIKGSINVKQPKLYLGRQRFALLLAGCAILACFLETWPAEIMLVADRGVRDGILAELIGDN